MLSIWTWLKVGRVKRLNFISVCLEFTVDVMNDKLCVSTSCPPLLEVEVGGGGGVDIHHSLMSNKILLLMVDIKIFQ